MQRLHGVCSVGSPHRELGVAALQQAALGLLELAERVVHSAREVLVKGAFCGGDVVVAGRVRELHPARPAHTEEPGIKSPPCASEHAACLAHEPAGM